MRRVTQTRAHILRQTATTGMVYGVQCNGAVNLQIYGVNDPMMLTLFLLRWLLGMLAVLRSRCLGWMDGWGGARAPCYSFLIHVKSISSSFHHSRQNGLSLLILSLSLFDSGIKSRQLTITEPPHQKITISRRCSDKRR